ncbi:MAG: hypothetical protein COY53_06055 [Elusimicrobia bacterium CG_4_10_14_0_8_um_filter_37_32]|nr:MAG: hypothetical protein COS17_05820 [Elusimicrobia bacterium CG02_land_8_20_14_3_00_37_13]PIZ13199.1 MAG: hypothetical protein COY53_06055 [Elusimicrobia bacterium CG_4_10_14_0_8_um_filter_37_32]
MEIVSIIAGCVSIILGFLAIALSVYFFIQSKISEKEVSNTLENIKAQTNTLQKITATQMTRLIKGVTEIRPEQEIITHLISLINVTPQQDMIREKDLQIENLTQEAITAYIASYYYSAVTNCLFQANLLPENEIENSELNNRVKNMIDKSYTDFNALENILNRVHTTRIQGNPLYNYYQETRNIWMQGVKDSKTTMESKQNS